MTIPDYKLVRTQFLPVTANQAWNFFSDPQNLPRITPPDLGLRILSDPPQKIHKGLIIEYEVKPFYGLPLKWVSEIADVNPPYQFVDEQVQGPYLYWHHLHQFKEVFGGVEMVDIVTYRLPFQQAMPWINTLFVAKRLDRIFDYRCQNLQDLLGR